MKSTDDSPPRYATLSPEAKDRVCAELRHMQTTGMLRPASGRRAKPEPPTAREMIEKHRKAK